MRNGRGSCDERVRHGDELLGHGGDQSDVVGGDGRVAKRREQRRERGRRLGSGGETRRQGFDGDGGVRHAFQGPRKRGEGRTSVAELRARSEVSHDSDRHPTAVFKYGAR